MLIWVEYVTSKLGDLKFSSKWNGYFPLLITTYLNVRATAYIVRK